MSKSNVVVRLVSPINSHFFYISQFLTPGLEVDVKLFPIQVLFLEQELRAHMALVTRQEELRAKSSYGMSSNKILRIDRLI